MKTVIMKILKIKVVLRLAKSNSLILLRESIAKCSVKIPPPPTHQDNVEIRKETDSSLLNKRGQ